MAAETGLGSGFAQGHVDLSEHHLADKSITTLVSSEQAARNSGPQTVLNQALLDSITAAVSTGLKAALKDQGNRHIIGLALDTAIQTQYSGPWDPSFRDNVVADVTANLTRALQELNVTLAHDGQKPISSNGQEFAEEGFRKDRAADTNDHLRQPTSNVCKYIVDDVFAAFTPYLGSDTGISRWTKCFFEEASFAEFRKAVATLAKRLPSNVASRLTHLELLQQVQSGIIRLGPVSKDVQLAIREQLPAATEKSEDLGEPSLLDNFTFLMELYDALVADAWKLSLVKRRDLDRLLGQSGHVAQILRQLEDKRVLLAEAAQTTHDILTIKSSSVQEQLQTILKEAVALQELDGFLADLPDLHAVSTLLTRFGRIAVTSTDIDNIISELTSDSEQYSSIIGLQNAIAALQLLRNVPSEINNTRGFRKLVDSVGHLSLSITDVKRSLNILVGTDNQPLNAIIEMLKNDLGPRVAQLASIQEQITKRVGKNLDKIAVAPKHSSIVHQLPEGMILQTVANFFSIEATTPIEVWGPEESVKAFVEALHRGYRRYETNHELSIYKRSLLALSTALDPFMKYYGAPPLGLWLLTSVLDDEFQARYQAAIQECADQYKGDERRSFVNTAMDDTRLTLQRIRVFLVMVRRKIIHDCGKTDADVRHIQLNIVIPATFHGGFYPITKPAQPSTFDIWLFNDDGQQEPTSSAAKFSLHSSWSAFAPANAMRAVIAQEMAVDPQIPRPHPDSAAQQYQSTAGQPKHSRSLSRKPTKSSSRPASRLIDKLQSSEISTETETCEAAGIHLWDPSLGEDLASGGLAQAGADVAAVSSSNDKQRQSTPKARPKSMTAGDALSTTHEPKQRPLSQSNPTAAESVLHLLRLGGDGASNHRSQKRKSMTESVKRSSIGSLQSLRKTLTPSLRRRGSHGSMSTAASGRNERDSAQPTREPPMPPAGEIMSPVNAELRERYGLGTYHRAGWLNGPDTTRALEQAGLNTNPEYLATLQHAESRQRLIRRNEKSLQYCLGSATEKRVHNKGRTDKHWDDINGPCNECKRLGRDCWVYIPSNFIIVKHPQGGPIEEGPYAPESSKRISNGHTRKKSTDKLRGEAQTPLRPTVNAINDFEVRKGDKGKQRETPVDSRL